MSDVADEDSLDLLRVPARQNAINLRVFFSRIANQHETAMRKALQHRFDHAQLVVLRGSKQIEESVIFDPKQFQVKAAGRKLIAAHEFNQRLVELPGNGRDIV